MTQSSRELVPPLHQVSGAVDASSQPVPLGAGNSAARKEKALTPRGCRSFTRRKMADAMPEIVDSFLVAAKAGSVPHTRFLSGLGGFDPRPASVHTPKRRRKSLARQMLEELEKHDAEQLAKEAAAGQSSTASPEDAASRTWNE